IRPVVMMHIDQRRVKRREIRRRPEECAFKSSPGCIHRKPAQHYDDGNNLRPPGTRTGCLIRGLRSRGHDPSDLKSFNFDYSAQSRTEHYSAILRKQELDFTAPASDLAARLWLAVLISAPVHSSINWTERWWQAIVHMMSDRLQSL